MKYVSAACLSALSLASFVVAQNLRVTAVKQLNCPVVIEQHENAGDGSLKSADLKNVGSKIVDSVRLGWIFKHGRDGKATNVHGKIIELRPGMTPEVRVTVASHEMHVPPSPPNTSQVEFYVESGYFSDGERFTCSETASKFKE